MVTNRVYKLLATNGTAATSLAAGTAGQYIMLKQDGTLWTTGSTPVKGDVLRIGVVGLDGVWYFFDGIQISNTSSLKIQAYAARVEQVITFTPDATFPVGQEYNLIVLDNSDKDILQMRQNKREYSVIAAAGETATTFVAKLVALINADAGASVVASGTTTLVLTAKAVETTANIIGEYTPQIYFDAYLQLVNLDYPLQNSGTKVYTTAPNFGSGNFDQVRKLEQRQQGYEGITNRTHFPVEQGLYTTVAGTNYDVIVVESDKVYNSNSETFGKVSSPITAIIPIPTGSSATFLTLIQDVLGITAS